MAHSSVFWDKVAERYSKKPVANEAAYQRKLRVTREYLRPDMQVLEIGCGTGLHRNSSRTIRQTHSRNGHLTENDRNCKGKGDR